MDHDAEAQAVADILTGSQVEQALQAICQAHPDADVLPALLIPGSVDRDPSEQIQALIRCFSQVENAHLVVGLGSLIAERQLQHLGCVAVDSLLTLLAEHYNEDLPALIRAQYAYAQAALAGLSSGEQAFEEPFVRGLCIAAQAGLEHRRRLHQYAWYLALRGRLSEIAEVLPDDTQELSDIDLDLAGDTASEFYSLRFIDAVECGRLLDAQALLPQIPEQIADPILEELLVAYDSVLLAWQQLLGQPLSASRQHEQEEMALLLDALLRRDRAQVFRAIEQADYAELQLPSTLFGYQSLRLALGLRDADLASDLLEQRRQQGLAHWLDGLIESRIALLSADVRAAQEHFAVCLRQAEHFDAVDRVDLELRVAMELSPIQLIWLGHGVEQQQQIEPSTHPYVLACQAAAHG